MSIAPMAKVTLAGRRTDKTRALRALQALGSLHIISLAGDAAPPEATPSREAEEARKVLRFLSVVPAPRRQIRRDPDFDVSRFVRSVQALQDRLRAARDQREALRARIEAVRPWGDVAFPPKEAIGGALCWFYQVPLRDRAALGAVSLPWAIVGTDARYAYVIVLSETEPPADALPVARTHFGSKPLSQLEIELEEAEIAIEALQAERHAATRYLGLLRANLAEAASRAEFEFAAAQTRDEDDVFVVRGWVPRDSLEALKEAADAVGLGLIIEAPTWTDAPPTALRQPDARRAGVDLAMVYQAPGYWGWDPSPVLMISFALFFAMILGDAGYGAALLLALLAGWRAFGHSVRGRSWRRMGLLIAGASIVYGVLVGGYFGAPPPNAFFARLQVLDLNDFDAMMTLSILVGVAHLVLAMAMAAWAKRGRASALASLGWIAGVLGAASVWLGAEGGPLQTIGAAGVALGAGAVLLFSSERPLITAADGFWRLVDGLRALTGVMGAFGDVLSYMRLFALGLASSSLALTFNDLAAGVAAAWPGLGVLAAILILLVGHTLNLALGLMSGVVHGLRLNFIEFYKWGLPVEGVAYRPLALKEPDE